MPTQFFDRLLSSYDFCVPAGYARVMPLLANPDLIKKFETKRWSELGLDDLSTLLFSFKKPYVEDFWVARLNYMLKLVINYLMVRHDYCLTWSEIHERFRLDAIMDMCEQEPIKELSAPLLSLLETLPGWSQGTAPSSITYQQFGFLQLGASEYLSPLSQYSRKNALEINRYIGGAMRLGGDRRAKQEFQNLFDCLDERPSLRSNIVSVVTSSRFDKNLYWHHLKPKERVGVLEDDLGI